jgi:Fe-Mn family superoxide dismutase
MKPTFAQLEKGMVLNFTKISKKLLNAWVDEQHLGQLNGCNTILALDMWEHSFVADYQPSGKKNYIEDFFLNLNWQIIENRMPKV